MTVALAFGPLIAMLITLVVAIDKEVHDRGGRGTQDPMDVMFTMVGTLAPLAVYFLT